ncbi:unnamed protein product [Sphagnum tenellum]
MEQVIANPQLDEALVKVAIAYASRTGCTHEEAWDDICNIVNDMRAADISVITEDREEAANKKWTSDIDSAAKIMGRLIACMPVNSRSSATRSASRSVLVCL